MCWRYLFLSDCFRLKDNYISLLLSVILEDPKTLIQRVVWNTSNFLEDCRQSIAFSVDQRCWVPYFHSWYHVMTRNCWIDFIPIIRTCVHNNLVTDSSTWNTNTFSTRMLTHLHKCISLQGEGAKSAKIFKGNTWHRINFSEGRGHSNPPLKKKTNKLSCDRDTIPGFNFAVCKFMICN